MHFLSQFEILTILDFPFIVFFFLRTSQGPFEKVSHILFLTNLVSNHLCLCYSWVSKTFLIGLSTYSLFFCNQVNYKL